jgi:WD40 repeat protein
MRPWRTRQELDQRAGSYMCAIRPDTDAVAIDVNQQTIELWDLVRSTRVRTLDPAGLGTLADIDFSPDGRLLAILDIEGQLQIWDMEENAPIAAPQRVSEPSLELRILGFPAPDRIMVETAPVFGGQTKTVVWDPNRRAAIAGLDFSSGSSVLSPDGRTLHRFGNHRSSHIPLDPLVWVDNLCRVGGRGITDAERQALPPGSVTDSVCQS